MTGEVVAGTEERLVTGDAVNVAARLEQAARPGQVLVGEPTLALVREAVEAEPVEPLELKGKAEPVAAHRLVRVREAPERRHDAPFVGRERELALLREAWERAHSDRRCELVTVVGEAGVGKSRLVAEAIGSVDATIVRGRCLPYGEGITYWPVVEVLKQLDVRPPAEAAASAIASLLGESDAATSAEEIAWAFRKTLEQAAAANSVVVVFDDLQWGEQTFHDLIEHVALLSAGVPILLLCMARPELVEHRPTWPVTLRLGPLAEGAVEQLIPKRIAGDLRERITRAAGGNPLFIHEMLAIAGTQAGDVTVPPTLRALLVARLDQLEPSERSVLERGAVEGEVFHRGAVQALAPEETQVTPRLAALVRKELIRPDRPQLAGEDGFRFRHLLIRDAAYDGLPKTVRAELHERFAGWLEQHGAQLVELDEILGYHLQQAHRYRAELGLEGAAALADTARVHLTTAGMQALLRSDFRAAASLFERAAALLPATSIDLTLETNLVEALFWAGRVSDAQRRAESLAERAGETGDRVAALCGSIQALTMRGFLEPEGVTGELAALLEEALPVCQTDGDAAALYTAFKGLSMVALMRAQCDAALDALEQTATHARRAGLPHEWLAWRAGFCVVGPMPASEVLAWLDEHEPHERPDDRFLAYRGWTLAMLGRFDEARAILAESRARLADRGGGLALALMRGQSSFHVELLAGDPDAAAAFGAEACRMLEELGERSMLSTMAGDLADALYALDRLEEADTWAGRAAELASSDDLLTQMLWRRVRAKLLARGGRHAEAQRLGHEAVAVGEQTDMLSFQGDAYADLAQVLTLSGKPDEAAAALEQALERYDRKGNLVSAERTRARLAELA